MLAHAKCPRCRETELVPVQAGPATLDRCGQCRGLWFDARGDELRGVLERRWERVPDGLKQGGPAAGSNRVIPTEQLRVEPLLCPRCASDMACFWYGGEAAETFVADACPLGHGVWLDAGELEKAFQALERFSRIRAEMERSGAVDDALARSGPRVWGPESVFDKRFWEYLAAILGTRVRL